MKMPRIAAGSDHAGFEYKEAIAKALTEEGYEVDDFGTFSAESADYPDFAHAVGAAIEQGDADFGILVCGSANGVAMTANKHPSVKAAVSWENDIAVLARRRNDANVICIPARFVSQDLAVEMTNLLDRKSTRLNSSHRT